MARDGLRVLGRSKTSGAERPKLRKPAPPRSKSFNDRKVRNSRRVSMYGQKGMERRYSKNITSIYIDPDNARWEIVRPRTSGEHDSLWGSDDEEEDDIERPKTSGNDSIRPSKIKEEDGLPYGFVPDPARFPARTTSKLRVPSQELIGVALGSPTHVPLMTTMTTTTSFDQSPKNTEGGSPLPVLPQHRMTLLKAEEFEPEQKQPQLQASPSKSSPSRAESIASTSQRGSWKKLLGKGIFSKRSSGGSGKKSMDTIDEDKEASHGSKSGNLLSIDIPKSDMERYSVMFGSVLNPVPAPPSPKEEQEIQPRRTIFERRIERDEAEKDKNYIVSDETPSSSPPQLRLSPKTPRHLNPDYYSDVLPLSLFPRTPRTPRTPVTPPDEEKLEELRKSLADALGAVNPVMDPKTPTELQRELNPSFTRKSRRPESDIVPSLMMILQNQQFDFDDVDRKSNMHMATESSPHEADLFRGPLSPFSIISETSSVDIALEEGIAVSDFPDPPNMVRLGAEQIWNWDMLTTPLRARTPVSAKIESPAPEMATVVDNSAAAKDEAERLIASAANLSISRQISMSQRQLNLPIVPDSDRLYFRPTRLDTMTSDVPFDFNLTENKMGGELPPMSAVQAVGDEHINYI